MSDFIAGKITPTVEKQGELFDTPADAIAQGQSIVFSSEAQAVMDAGRRLWRYYHEQPQANPNASFYDIRLHFQGIKTTKSGKQQMNTESSDENYTALITDLREKMKLLAKHIEPKVYEYGFLKKWQ